MSATLFPIVGAMFSIECAPIAGGAGVVQLVLSSRQQTLTPAGLGAAITQIDSYYATSSGAKIVAVARAADRNLLSVEVSASQVSYTVLAGDVTGQVSALATIVQTPGNIQ